MKPSMFIKLDGIDGESEDDDHEKWIDILSWSWGMSQSASTHIGGGGSNAQASVQDVSFVKWVDKSTPGLMHCCLSGKHIAKAELHCTKSGGDKWEDLTHHFQDLPAQLWVSRIEASPADADKAYVTGVGGLMASHVGLVLEGA